MASEEHFSVDGTLIESYASLKSLRPIGSKDERVSDGSEDGDPGNPTVSFRGERRRNATHRSVVDPEARLMRKGWGREAKLAHGPHVLMENRSGLVVDVSVSEAWMRAEREQALGMLRRTRRRHRLPVRALAAHKSYDAGAFLHGLEVKERGKIAQQALVVYAGYNVLRLARIEERAASAPYPRRRRCSSTDGQNRRANREAGHRFHPPTE